MPQMSSMDWFFLSIFFLFIFFMLILMIYYMMFLIFNKKLSSLYIDLFKFSYKYFW